MAEREREIAREVAMASEARRRVMRVVRSSPLLPLIQAAFLLAVFQCIALVVGPDWLALAGAVLNVVAVISLMCAEWYLRGRT